MKKITTFIMLAMLALSFTSCETEDDNIARALDGIWSGTVAQRYVQQYSAWRYKEGIAYQDIEMQFYTDPYYCAEGDGVEYDFDRRGYVENRFRFYVRNQRIYIDYEYGMDVVIMNYDLRGNIFDGSFYQWYNSAPGYEKYSRWDIGGKIAEFELDRVSSWRHSGYSRYDYWGMYAKKGSVIETDSIK